jgi:predicted RNase H-like HicB family nuclease
MKYAYPAVLTPDPGGGYTIVFPDLLGCVTEGDTLAETLYMATDALAGWLYCVKKQGKAIPAPSDIDSVAVAPGESVTLVWADVDAYRRAVEAYAVKKTLTIPSWLNVRAEAANVNFSQVLQDALQKRLGLQH